MEEDSKEEVPVSGGHEHLLQAHRPDDRETVAVKPRPLGACVSDGIAIGEK